jgi:hypothetical protein
MALSSGFERILLFCSIFSAQDTDPTAQQRILPCLGILACWAERNLVDDPFCHNAVCAQVLAAGATSSLMFGTNCPTADLTDRSGLVIAKRTLLGVIPDHLSSSCLEDLSIGFTCGNHVYRDYGNVQ